MQPALNDEELEGWHREWIEKMLLGEATAEEYYAAIPPYPDRNHQRMKKK